jgi:hypothetical protein
VAFVVGMIVWLTWLGLNLFVQSEGGQGPRRAAHDADRLTSFDGLRRRSVRMHIVRRLVLVPSLARTAARVALYLIGYALLSAVVGAPIAAEHTVETVRFEDRLGTLPVEVSLAHNGVSTLDTGILGRLYWDRTGTGGFGAVIRATGPPEAGGTLSSYVSPTFLRTNAQFVNDPGEVARVYGVELRSALWGGFWRTQLWIAIIGGAVLTAVFRARVPLPTGLVGRGVGWASASP